MVEEVNKLIFNALISEKALHLPGVGTLYVERRSASMEGGRLVSPSHDIAFSSHIEARSIIDIIINAASVSRSKAEDIYARWIGKMRNGNSLIISGVGVLCDKSFVADKELIENLNRFNIGELHLTKKKGSALRIIAAIVAILIILTGGYYAYIYNKTYSTIDVDNIEQIDEITVVTDITISPDVVDVVAEEIVLEPKAVEVTTTSEVTDWRTSTDIRHRVIFGSYSTIENASRAAMDIERQNTELKCDIFQLGSMYAVTIFGSTERSDCEVFMRSYRNRFSQAWIYTPKRFK